MGKQWARIGKELERVGEELGKIWEIVGKTDVPTLLPISRVGKELGNNWERVWKTAKRSMHLPKIENLFSHTKKLHHGGQQYAATHSSNAQTGAAIAINRRQR